MKSGRTGGPPGNIFSRFVDMERPVAFLAASRTPDWHVWIFSRGERQPGPERIASRMNFTCVHYELTTFLPASLLSYYNNKSTCFPPSRVRRIWKEDGFVRDLVARIFISISVCIRCNAYVWKDWNKIYIYIYSIGIYSQHVD